MLPTRSMKSYHHHVWVHKYEAPKTKAGVQEPLPHQYHRRSRHENSSLVKKMANYCRNSNATAAVTNFAIEEFTQVPLLAEEIHGYCSRHQTRKTY